MVRKEYKGGAPATALSSGIDNATLSIPLVDGTGYPTGAVGKFFIVIDRGLSTEEKIYCDTRVANAIAANALGRGADDTTPSSHSEGAKVEHVFTAEDADEANEHINDATQDDHTQYTLVDGTRAFTGVTTIAGSPVAVGTANADGSAVTLARSDHVHRGSRFVGWKLYKSTDQTLSQGNTTDITFDSETFDTDAFHTGSDANITVPAGFAGYYRITARLKMDDPTSITSWEGTLVWNNGSDNDVDRAVMIPGGTNEQQSVLVSAVVNASVGDTMRLEGFVSGTSADVRGNGEANTWFIGEYLGPAS